MLCWHHVMKDLFWKNASEAVCKTDDAARSFLAALAPAHRLRMLSLVAMQHVGKAYYHEEAVRRPMVLRAKELEALVASADSGSFQGAFQADPVVAMQCLNQDKSRSIKVFTNVSGDSAINNLTVLASGIALTAQSLVSPGSGGTGSSSSASSSLLAGSSGRGEEEAERRQQLRQQLQEFLSFLADRYKEARVAGKVERALEMSRGCLFDLLHAQTAIAALG